MKNKYIVAALLSIILLFTSLPVSAMEVSDGDIINSSYKLLSNSRITNNTSGSVSKKVYVSRFADIIDVDFQFANLDLSLIDGWDQNNNVFYVRNDFSIDVQEYNSSSPLAEIIDYIFYAIVDGKKFYFESYHNNINVNDFIVYSNVTLGVELSFSVASSDFDIFYDYNGSGTSTGSNNTENFVFTGSIYNQYLPTKELPYTIIVSWPSLAFDVWRSGTTNNSLLQDIRVILNNINNNISGLYTKIENGFQSIITKMDDDQEEIINGFDPSTGNTADSEFNDGADELHNVENSLFQSAAYDEVDYSQYNDFFSLTGVAGAMSFVASFFESLYSALGIYAVPFTIGLVLIIITRILGYQNFSAGGG